MPEGPEVKTFADQLNQIVGGKKLVDGKVLGGRFLKDPISLELLKLPCLIKEVRVKGKFIYWMLEGEVFFFNTLGMTGGWGLEKEKHAHLELQLEDGKRLYFIDPRRFGTFKMVCGAEKLQEKLDSLGPDMLNDPPTLIEFEKRITKKLNICQILMDQKIISGVGNYIKAESLYLAGISPWRIGTSLTAEEIKKLYQAIRQVMTESYTAGGTTLATYRDTQGNKGEYWQQLKVYGKEKDGEEREVIKEGTPDGRTTWWVREAQK